jgi:hypothetical protein
MIFLLLLSTLVHAQTDVLVGQYVHARAEAEFAQYLDDRGVSMQEATTLDEKAVCSFTRLEEFGPQLEEIRLAAQKVLKDLKGEGEDWRRKSTYGDASKDFMTEPQATDYVVERLRFARLEAFGRLSKLAPTCLDIFRRDPTGANKSSLAPRFRVESVHNVTPALFCGVAVRYWKDIKRDLHPACLIPED